MRTKSSSSLFYAQYPTLARTEPTSTAPSWTKRCTFAHGKRNLREFVSKEAQNTHGKDSQGLAVSKKAFHTHQIVLVPVLCAIPYPDAHETYQHSTFVSKKAYFRARKTSVAAFVSREAQNTHGKDSQGLAVSKKAFHTHQIILVPTSCAIPYLGTHGIHHRSTFVDKKVYFRARKTGAEESVRKKAIYAHQMEAGIHFVRKYG